MDRRKFLGAGLGAAVAGPAAAKQAVENIGSGQINKKMILGEAPRVFNKYDVNKHPYLAEDLLQLINGNDTGHGRPHDIYDPNVYELRSVSTVNKLRMSQTRQRKARVVQKLKHWLDAQGLSWMEPDNPALIKMLEQAARGKG